MPGLAEGRQNAIGGDSAACEVQRQSVIQQRAGMVRMGDNEILACRHRRHAVFPAIRVGEGDRVEPHRIRFDTGPGSAFHGRRRLRAGQGFQGWHRAGR